MLVPMMKGFVTNRFLPGVAVSDIFTHECSKSALFRHQLFGQHTQTMFFAEFTEAFNETCELDYIRYIENNFWPKSRQLPPDIH